MKFTAYLPLIDPGAFLTMPKRLRPRLQDDSAESIENKPRAKERRRQFSPYIRKTPLDDTCSLCSRCRSIDFDAILKIGSIPRNGIPVYDLGPSPVPYDETC